MRIGMMRREYAGSYQCGIYAIDRVGRRRWRVQAVGPGTIGDGFIGEYPTLAVAYEQCTGEPLHVATRTIKASEAEWLSTRQVAARIRTGKLPTTDKGQVRCVCHPDKKQRATTENLRFWSKDMFVGCGDRKNAKATPQGVPALAFFPDLGVAIDTTR